MGNCVSSVVSHEDESWIPAEKKTSKAEDEENQQYLERLFSQTKPLCDFSENLLSELYFKSTVRNFKKGEVVYRKGQVANAFYIVVRGAVQSEDGHIVVGQGEMVGQMEIIENLKCLKTMQAGETGCKLRQIKRADFDAALEKKNSVLQTNVFKVLCETPVFSGLSERELMSLKDQLHLKTYAGGEVIIKKGDYKVEEMYIIEDGAVLVTNFGQTPSPLDFAIFGLASQSDPKQVVKLEKRGYFGEEALLVEENDASDEAKTMRARGADVTAAPGGCSCLVLSKDVFEKNLRKIKHKFYRNIYARDHEFDDLVRKNKKRPHEREAHALETHKSGKARPGKSRQATETSNEDAADEDAADQGRDDGAANRTTARRLNDHRAKRASSAAALGLVHVDADDAGDDNGGKKDGWLNAVLCGTV